MSARDTGGAAFPHMTMCTESGQEWVESDISVRDYFAAKAMQSLVTCLLSGGSTMKAKDDAAMTEAVIADQAYDAMLAEKAKP